MLQELNKQWFELKSCKTKGELSNTHTFHAFIRMHARNDYFRNNDNKSCEKCGYSKYIEICHKIPIKDFDDNTTLGEINNRDNLIGLCPNCHWEMDNCQ